MIYQCSSKVNLHYLSGLFGAQQKLFMPRRIIFNSGSFWLNFARKKVEPPLPHWKDQANLNSLIYEIAAYDHHGNRNAVGDRLTNLLKIYLGVTDGFLRRL